MGSGLGLKLGIWLGLSIVLGLDWGHFIGVEVLQLCHDIIVA